MTEINHILLELFCMWEYTAKTNDKKPDFCYGNTPRYACLFNKCPYLSFTSCEDTLCYTNSFSETESDTIVSLGGEMLPDSCNEEDLKLLWKKISKRKIEEAYQEYMKNIE